MVAFAERELLNILVLKYYVTVPFSPYRPKIVYFPRTVLSFKFLLLYNLFTRREMYTQQHTPVTIFPVRFQRQVLVQQNSNAPFLPFPLCIFFCCILYLLLLSLNVTLICFHPQCRFASSMQLLFSTLRCPFASLKVN